MCQVNVFQAKTDFSKLLAKLESAEEDEIVIARNGKPVARLVPWEEKDSVKRIGAAKGIFRVPEDIDRPDAEVAAFFLDRRRELPRRHAHRALGTGRRRASAQGCPGSDRG